MGLQWLACGAGRRPGPHAVTGTGASAPWLARREWAERRITDRSRAGTWALTGFALFWNAIAWTVVPAVFRPESGAREPARYAVLIFPVAGLFLAAAAARAVLRQLRYGASILELATLPGPPGRLLAGVIETRGVIAPTAGFRVRLSCLRRRVRSSGKNRSTSEELLWQDEQVIPGASRLGGGIGIPFAIPLPADAHETDERDAADKTVWRLTVDADVSGVDYSAGFEVPVFRTAESDTPLGPDELARLDPTAEGTPPGPASGIGCHRTVGGLVVEFPAGRAPRAAWAMVWFTLLWTAVIVVMLRLGAPVFLALIFGLFDLVLFVGIGQVFLLRTWVRAEAGDLVVASALAGVPLGERRVDGRRVTRVGPEPGFRTGTDTWWDLAMWLDDGRKVILGRTIPTRREAEWLAAELRTTLSPAV